MKKLIIIACVFTLFACSKKEWTCTCTLDSDGSIVNISEYELNQKDAEQSCSNADEVLGISCVLEEK